MTTEFGSSDVRRSTIVKIAAKDHLDSLTALPKMKNISEKVESVTNRWTSNVTLSQTLGDNSLLNSLTPNPSPSSTLTKPKAINSPKDSSFDNKKVNSSDYDISETIPNSFVDNFKRSETFSKKFKDFNERESEVIHDSRNSRCIFLSQIHLIFHISITICLFGYKGYDTNIRNLMSNQTLIITYFLYLMVLSIVFMLLLRYFCVYSDDIGLKEIRSEQLSILLGTAFLGMIHLIYLSLEVFECMDTELVLMPILEFVFTFLLNHYLLTQVIQDRDLGLRNIVISHLLSTQISLWLISFDAKPEVCSFNDGYEYNSSSLKTDTNIRNSLLPRNVLNLMIPIIHDYKLLTIFILITIWFTSNQSKISFIRAKLFDEEALKTAFLSGKSSALKGFSIGFALFLLSIVVILLEDKEILKTVHILIQTIFGFVLMIGLLIMRRKKKYLNYKYKMNFLDYHFMVYITLLAAFAFGLRQVIFNSSHEVSYIYQIFDGLTLIIQISLQSFLIRLQRRKFVVMNQIFILSVLSNLSLWILEIFDISDKLSTVYMITNSLIILNIFVSLNRFYSALVFYQFWKSN